jgi:malonyl-CoA O-methyltransferase
MGCWGGLMKSKIAAAFNKAVKSYDRTAIVQQTIANWLLRLLPTEQELNNILDLGCGTGFVTYKLAEKFPAAKIYGVDFASEMIAHAKDNCRADNLEFLCADVESMPFASNFAELAFSNCTLQWASDLELMLHEINRVLAKNGKLFFATLIQGTLQELQDVCALNSFKTVAEIKQALEKTGFTNINLTTKNLVLHFSKMKDLMYHLKSIGANYVVNRNEDFMSKKMFAKLNNQDKVKATFTIVYGWAQI